MATAQPLMPWKAARPLGAGIAEILDAVQVQAVSAVLWQCSARWEITPRVITDEMFFLTCRGRGWMDIGGRRVDLAPGSSAHIRRSVRHSAGNAPDDPIQVIAIHYQAQVAGASLAQLVDIPDVMPVSEALSGLAEEACREYAQRSGGWRRRLDALVTDFVISLVRGIDTVQAAPDLAEARRLLPAIDAMRNRLAEAPSLVSLARLCGLSSAQFRRCFHRAFGCAPMEHVHRLRIAEAARLLRAEALPVVEVAARVGYADPSWFSRTFTRIIGETPGVFARRSGP